MRRAIEMARARLGTTGLNPVVGCVIAKEDAVISEAVTAPGGRPHAEEQALARAGSSAAGTTAYVSLEPCGERSSGAASCAERLVAAGVVRVVYAVANPDPRSAGRGPARLRAAGVALEQGLLAPDAADLYAEFLSRYEQGGALRTPP